MKKITLLVLLAISSNLFAQIINTAPYILTVSELKQWTATGPTASTDLIATENLAPRFINTATQFNTALSNDMKIAYLPDGMNNFGNYYGEQSQFNLYNFTHWAYIDKLVWFGGTASQSVQIPSSPWVNAAHKNGVKVFGNVFFAPTVFGGSTATLINFLEQDLNGNFVAIPKMIAIMQYYNFDGWFINEETATNATTGQLMYAFVRDLTQQAESIGKEVMWYDSMLLSGSISYQNRLNNNNAVFVQNNEDNDLTNGYEKRVSSNIFINFFWSSASLPTFSRTKAIAIGRSEFDVFTGVDIWPGRNQGNFEINGNTFMSNLHTNTTTPYTSLGIFAPNCVFNNSTFSNFNNDPSDVASFYNAENHLFAGDDSNPAIVDASGFKGLSNWIPETTVINTIPFQTNFCTGHGTKKFTSGVQTSSNSWHNMNEQDILPTWQFAFSENGMLNAEWDFDNALVKGNSLKISGILPADTPIDLMLYKTKLNSSGGALSFNMFYKTLAENPSMKILIVYSDEPNQKYEFTFTSGIAIAGWHFGETNGFISNFPQREIAKIGLRFESLTDIPNYSINIGGIYIDEVFLGTTSNNKNNNYVTVSYPNQKNDPLIFTINWPVSKEIKYIVYDLQGKAIQENRIVLKGITTFPFNINNLSSGSYIVKFFDDKNIQEVKKIIVK